VSETAGATGEQPQVTEEQVREYLSKLREVPAEHLVAELLSSLLNTAQAKLGRRDARLLIDLSGLMINYVRRHVSTQLSTQIDQALTQLRLGQVRTEEAAAGGGHREPNDLAEAPPPPADRAGVPSSGPPPAAPEPSPASRLWVPGQNL
jgi:hypothetical protein